MLSAHVSVATLMDRHPWAAEVLEWHGVDIDRVDLRMSLGTLCWLHRLDPIRVARDLMAANPDEAVEVSELVHGAAANNNEMWEFDERMFAVEPWEVDEMEAWVR